MVWPIRVLVISFRLKNTPLVFMDLLNQVFHEHLDFGVVAFTDYLLVYLTNLIEHETHLMKVLEVLEKMNSLPSS